MAWSRRGKVVAGVSAAVVVVGGAIGALALTGHVPIVDQLIGKPDTCPLTGAKPKSGSVPDRPALAIKVENLPEARPQAGVQFADVIYEEPVEGGITRFIVLYQCHDAKRVGPVRSARFTDLDILPQYGTQTLFGYAGGAPKVEQRVQESGLVDLGFQQPKAAHAFVRDPNRSAPHNLYTSTAALYRAGGTGGGLPTKVLSFSSKVPSTAKPASKVNLDFSGSANMFWTYNKAKDLWVRSYDTGPASLEGGGSITARNVVVQVVKLKKTGIVDAAGNPSPEVVATGTGACFVFRNGGVIRGTWNRPTDDDLTTYQDTAGNKISLSPGTTWIELLPNGITPSITK
jgi:hypothetical protein